MLNVSIFRTSIALAVTLLATACTSISKSPHRAVASDAPGLPKEGRVIGQTKVGDDRKFKTIETSDGDRITSIKLCAIKDDLHIGFFLVDFAHGPSQQIETRDTIRKNTCTEWRDLDGEVRNVRRVQIFGKSDWDPKGKDTTLLVYGYDERPFADIHGRRVGSTRIDNSGTFAQLSVPNGRNLSELKVCAAGDDLFVNFLAVTFGDGSSQQITTRPLIAKGTCTAWKDLEGGNRNIKSIHLFAASDWDFRDKDTTAVFFGDIEPNFSAEGGKRLGATRIDCTGTYEDILPAENSPKFSRIKLCAAGDELKIGYFGVIYGDGEIDRIKTAESIQNGRCTGWKQLNGNRFIKRVQLIGHGSWDSRGKDTRAVVLAQ